MVKKDKRFFLDAVEIILKHEGGYINDIDDPGGETNFGISKRQYPNIDIKELTRDEAIQIYFNDYWTRCRCSELPTDIRGIYFDMAVNLGGRRACFILQESINKKGGTLKTDGKIGKNTLHQSFKYKIESSRLKAYRIKYYVELVNRKPKLEKYYYGWFKRAMV
tara:strand:- start:5147 stop:5638 length:492 start_codon:yes stop_codon:yes gene_type:complete